MDKRPKLRRAVKNSLILSSLNRFSALVYKKLSAGFFGRVFSSYEKTQAMAETCLLARFAKRAPSAIAHKAVRPMKRALARSFEESRILGMAASALNHLRLCSLRVYGTFFLSFGLYTLLVFLIKRYAILSGSPSLVHLLTGGTLVLMSLPLLFSHRPLADGIMSSTLLRAFLFSFAGLRPELIEQKGSIGGGRKNIAFILGMVLGALTFFFSPIAIIAGVAALILAYIILLSPEFGVIFSLFATPFLLLLHSPTILLCLIVLYTAFSFLIKLIRGKRVIRFDLLDFFVAAFAVLMLAGGLVSVGGRGSLLPAMVYTCLLLGYFLTVNLMNTAEWLHRAVGALMASSFIVAVWGIAEQFFGAPEGSWLDTNMFADIRIRVASAFENPNMLGEYLILLIPMAVARLLLSKSASKAAVRLSALAALLLCLVLTWSRGAWLGLIAGLLLFFLIYSKKTLSALIMGCFALPFLPLFLPQTVWHRLSSIGNLADTSSSYRLSIWRGVVRMLRDYSVSGIGVGEAAFEKIYGGYQLPGIAAPHSHHLYLQLLAEIGVFGLLIFLALLFFFAQSSFNHLGTTENKASRLLAAAALSGVFGALIQGFTDYVWYNYRVYFIFWAIIGIAAAIRRCGAANRPGAADRFRRDDSCAFLDIPVK